MPSRARASGSERAVAALLLFAALLAVAFIVAYALDRLPDQTQLMGAALGLALLAIAAALLVAARTLVPDEQRVEQYPPDDHPADEEEVARIVVEGGEPLSRSRLLRRSAGLAGAALVAALAVPLASLGPVTDLATLTRAPWRRGTRLVDEQGRPLRASEIEQDALYTAFPEGADRETLAAPIVLVRLPAAALRLPQGDVRYDADGIVAYSKICTHAGCAISLYRAPLFPQGEPAAALVCPCHYSIFDPATGGNVVSGPAGRKLPMLPLRIDRRGQLRATGTFDGPVGASWLEVRRRSAS